MSSGKIRSDPNVSATVPLAVGSVAFHSEGLVLFGTAATDGDLSWLLQERVQKSSRIFVSRMPICDRSITSPLALDCRRRCSDSPIVLPYRCWINFIP